MRRPPVVDIVLALAGAALTCLYGTTVVAGGFTWYETSFTAIHLGLTLALLTRTTHRRVSFVASYALLAAMALVVGVAPINLGVSPAIIAAPLALYAMARHEPTPWGVSALFLGLIGAFVSPLGRVPGATSVFVVWMILLMVGTYLWGNGRRRTDLAHAAELARRTEELRLRGEAQAAQARHWAHDLRCPGP